MSFGEKVQAGPGRRWGGCCGWLGGLVAGGGARELLGAGGGPGGGAWGRGLGRGEEGPQAGPAPGPRPPTTPPSAPRRASQACEDGIQPPPVSPQRPHRPPAPQPRGSGCRPVPSLGRFGPPRPPRPPGTRGRLGCGWASLKGWEEEEVCGVCSGVLPVQRAPSVPRGALRWSRRGGGHGRGGPEGTAAAAAAALGEGGVGGKGTDRKAEEKKAYSTRYSQAVSHPSTNQARPCLASEIRRDRARSGWYGRRRPRLPLGAPRACSAPLSRPGARRSSALLRPPCAARLNACLPACMLACRPD